MIQKVKTYLLVFASTIMLAIPALVPMTVSAGCTNVGDKVVEGANAAIGGGGVDCNTSAGNGTDQIKKLASTIVNIFSVVVGAISVIMIIYGGFRYITSAGDSGRVGNAKSTILYAVIGLIIVVLAQLIVHFVVGQTGTVTQ